MFTTHKTQFDMAETLKQLVIQQGGKICSDGIVEWRDCELKFNDDGTEMVGISWDGGSVYSTQVVVDIEPPAKTVDEILGTMSSTERHKNHGFIAGANIGRRKRAV